MTVRICGPHSQKPRVPPRDLLQREGDDEGEFTVVNCHQGFSHQSNGSFSNHDILELRMIMQNMMSRAVHNRTNHE